MNSVQSFLLVAVRLLMGLVLLVVAALLLSGWFVPLAQTTLAPAVVDVMAYHVFLALVAGSGLYLAWVYRESFREGLTARVAQVTVRGGR